MSSKWALITFFTVMFLDVCFDFGKWGLGRYTTVPTFISIFAIVSFSAVLAGAVELIHKIRRNKDKRHEQYIHHKAKVWVTKGQKGNHWKSSLCPECALYLPDTLDNCLIESTVHITSRDNHLALVVWECQGFIQKIKEKQNETQISKTNV